MSERTPKGYRKAWNGELGAPHPPSKGLRDGLNAASVSPQAGTPLPYPLADRTLAELDQLSIRTGCETEINRQADLELHRRGYAFDAKQARWVKVASDYDAMKLEHPELLAKEEADLASGAAPAEPLTVEPDCSFQAWQCLNGIGRRCGV